MSRNHFPLPAAPVTAFVDQVARDDARAALAKAEKAEADVVNHEELCAVRYQGILDAIGTIKRVIGWAGATTFTLLVGTLGWLLVQQVNGNDDDKAQLRAQIELLEHQIATAPAATAPVNPTAAR